MKPIKVTETPPHTRAQNLQDRSQQFDFCDVCGKECNEKRFCCAATDGYIHFDVCSEACAELGIFQRI